MAPNSRFTPPFRPGQTKALSIIPRITSSFSIVASLYIIQHVLQSSKRRAQTYHRLLLCMALMDFIYSVKCFCSTWVIPEFTNIYGARGTVNSCTWAAFWGHGSALSSALLNASLTHYFLITIVFGKKQTSVRQNEWWLIGLPLTIGWSTAIAGLRLDLYNPIGWTCWIGRWPPTCTDNCQRGQDADLYRWVFFHAWLWAAFLYIAVAMLSMYLHVRGIEASSSKWRPSASPELVLNDSSLSGTSSQNQKRPNLNLSRKFASQAWLYVIAFFACWISAMLMIIIDDITGYLLYPVLVITVIINPLQGFFNAVIYVRPRYLRQREKQHEAAPLRAFLDALSSQAIEGDRRVRDLEQEPVVEEAQTQLGFEAEALEL